MKKTLSSLTLTSVLGVMFAGLLLGQAPAPQQQQPQPGAGRGGQAAGAGNRGGRGAPIVLAEDDKPAYPAAPAGFDSRRAGIPTGSVELVEYDSKSVGAKRRLNVYLPPGYSKDVKYPVFYLLHGAGGNETSWRQQGTADQILDNLYADKKVVPMIVVMPHGIPQPAGAAQPAAAEGGRGPGRGAAAPAAGERGRGGGAAPAAGERGGGGGGGGRGRGGGGIGGVNYNATNALFETDLIQDIIPFVEARYPVIANRQSRAVAGLSLGGGQSFVIGTKRLDTFAYIGGFSSAILGVQPASLAADAENLKNLKLYWVSCGDTDTLFNSSQSLHRALKEKNVPHVWHVDSGAHVWPVWKNDLYLIAQLLFR